MKLKKDILIIFILILAISMTILPNYLNDLDELWNFNFAKNIAEDRVPYRDFNMIMTPLFPILASIFLKLFGTELIVMRFLAIILCTAIFFLIYRIMKLLDVHKVIIYSSISALYLLFFSHFRIDYNLSMLLIVLIVLYNEIKRVKEKNMILEYNFKRDFFLGILMGTTILFKHTAGLFITSIFILYKLLLVPKKEQIRKAFEIILTRLLGAFIPVILLIIYLSVNNIWLEFLDYTIYSIGTFTNYIPYTYLIKNSNIYIAILSILVPISIMYMYIRSIVMKINNNYSQILFVLFSYSVATLIFAYPLADNIHFLIGAIPTIIAIVYIGANLLNEIKKKYKIDKFLILTKNSLEFATYVFAVCIIITSVITNFDYFFHINATSNLSHYKYIRIGEEAGITEISRYILEQEKKDKKVYILDASASIYMIPIEKYNKDYDMFNKGNLGSQGEVGQIDKLAVEKNVIVLILNDNYRRNWQNPEEVRKYIVANWEKTGEIRQFDIYERND